MTANIILVTILLWFTSVFTACTLDCGMSKELGLSKMENIALIVLSPVFLGIMTLLLFMVIFGGILDYITHRENLKKVVKFPFKVILEIFRLPYHFYTAMKKMYRCSQEDE